ncbi:MAG: hypothetical protein R3D00_22855 [Bacteroidia bacterium]
MKKSVKNIIGALLLVAMLAGGAAIVSQVLKSETSSPVAVQTVDMDHSISVLP